jgi:hypothetical protein
MQQKFTRRKLGYTRWDNKINEDNLDKLKIKPVTLYSELSEEMERTCEHNEHRKNLKTNFTLSANRANINVTSNEDVVMTL